MKGKKLPNLWVSFDHDGVEYASLGKPQERHELIGKVHRYTPAKPAKTKKCKCAGRCISGPWKFCPYCGGKLKAKR